MPETKSIDRAFEGSIRLLKAKYVEYGPTKVLVFILLPVFNPNFLLFIWRNILSETKSIDLALERSIRLLRVKYFEY